MIEAVSKGLIDDNQDPIIEIKQSRVEISPLNSPLTNGIQKNLNDSKVVLERQIVRSPVKSKASKNVKNEIEKEKEKEKKDKNRERKKVREKLKQKTKPKPPNDMDSSRSTTVQGIKHEEIKSNEKYGVAGMNRGIEKSADKTTDVPPKSTELDATIDSTNINILNTEHTETTPEQTLNCATATADVPNNSNKAIESTATSTTSTPAIMEMNANHKLNRKHRKEKHRNKHRPDAERSSGKEHKKKRKRKYHDHENTETFPHAGGVPTIKIKV